MKPLIISCLLTIAALTVASESDAPTTPAAQNTWDRYKILSQRNIFSKDRGRIREERRTKDESTAAEKETPPAPKPETEIMLIGILQKDGVFEAFFENSKTGAVQTLRTGDSIARGKIATISLDSIEYATDAGSSTVAIGTNLDGAIVAKSTTTTKSTASGDAGASDANAILERMRKKRQEEMRK